MVTGGGDDPARTAPQIAVCPNLRINRRWMGPPVSKKQPPRQRPPVGSLSTGGYAAIGTAPRMTSGCTGTVSFVRGPNKGASLGSRIREDGCKARLYRALKLLAEYSETSWPAVDEGIIRMCQLCGHRSAPDRGVTHSVMCVLGHPENVSLLAEDEWRGNHG